MPAYTSNFNLYKPNRADTEEVDTTLSANFDTIDTEIKKRKDELDTHKTAVDAHESVNIKHGDGNVQETLFDLGTRISGSETRVEHVEDRISTIVAQAGTDNTEIVDARGGFTALHDRLENVDSQLAETMNNIINVVSGYNADPTGVIDSTNAFKTAISDSIANKKTLYIPPGTYLVTSNLLSVTRDSISRVRGLSIVGAGNMLSVIKFNPVTNSEICLDLTNVWHGLFKDFMIQGVGIKGIGMQLGDPTIRTTDSNTYNCDFVNVYVRDLDIGIKTNYAWGNSFVNLKTRYCNKGMISYGGANSFTAYNAEACYEYGMKIIGELIGGGSGTTVSFNGLLIENNPIGMIIDSGNVVINNAYFEANTTANIQAGINGYAVDSILINGVHNGLYDKFIFDQVNSLTIKGITGYTFYNQFQISKNVKSLNIDESSQMINNTSKTHINTINAQTKKANPIVANNLQTITSFVNPLPLDFTGAATMRQATTTGSLATFDGKQVIKYVSTGGSFNGMFLQLDFANRYLKNYKKLKVKTKIYIDTTTFASISNSRLNTKVRINYTNTSAGTSFKDFYDVNPSDSNNTLYNMRNNHITHTVDLDLDEMIATIADYSAIQTIYVYYYPIVTAVGGETFYFEGIEIYPHTNVKDAMTDNVNTPPFGQPVLISPNGTKYTLSVSDAGVLTATTVTY